MKAFQLKRAFRRALRSLFLRQMITEVMRVNLTVSSPINGSLNLITEIELTILGELLCKLRGTHPTLESAELRRVLGYRLYESLHNSEFSSCIHLSTRIQRHIKRNNKIRNEEGHPLDYPIRSEGIHLRKRNFSQNYEGDVVSRDGELRVWVGAKSQTF